MATIDSFTPGTAIEGIYGVRRADRRLSRKGRPFLDVTLGDATGAIRGVVLDQPDFFAERFSVGDTVRVTGRVSERGGKAELLIDHISATTDIDEAPVDLLPRSHRDPDELFGFVLHLADEIADPGLRALMESFTSDEVLVEAWKQVPCTRGGHHSYRGGLIEHTVGVAALCQTLCQWHPRLDVDLLLAAALVHDIGHARAFRVGATFELTDEGRALGHLTLGDAMIGDRAAGCGLDRSRALAVRHAVAWHHGAPPGQSPSSASPEALALLRANALEAGVKGRLEGSGPTD
ncbi:MAG: HD domain-containing protein [Thermoleophilia bacterium]|nr:HD domain-containing protein [Thermoleophilia bacterium]